MIGTTVSHYEILEKLGEGGMGVVYKAHDQRLDRSVALKFLPPHLSSNPEANERFIREAKAASGLDHPNICTIYDIGETDKGQLFIAMAFYQGQTLKYRLAEGLSIDRSVDIAIQIAEGLERAHEAGIIHRDIKPANVMITDRGRVKILDFGVAKLGDSAVLTKVGSTVGTVAYMSPEQTRGEVVDGRTDIWSLGVVMYEMLTGRRPFRGDYAQAVVYSILNQDPELLTAVRSQVPFSQQRIVENALEKDPGRRYPNVQALLQDLRTALTSEPPTGQLETSMVVLPFTNLSPDPEQEYFSDGLTEEIITDLSQIHTLRVISRTSAMMLKGTQKNIRTIGRELGVQYVLEGSVRKAGNRLRITAQLIDAVDDAHLWAEKYHGTIEDVFGIQEEVSRSIVDALKLALSPEEEVRISTHPINNALAYEYYLKSRREHLRFTKESLDRALQYLQKGLEVVGENELLLAGMGYVYFELVNMGFKTDEAYVNKAEAYAQRAFQLNPDSAYSHLVLGLLQFWRKNLRQGIRHLKRVLSIKPDDFDALMWLGVHYGIYGKSSAALSCADRLTTIDPLNPRGHWLRGLIRIWAGQFDLAVEAFEHLMQFAPDDFLGRWHYALTLALLDRRDEAFSLFSTLAAEKPGHPRTELGLKYIAALEGNKAEVLRWEKPGVRAWAWRDNSYSYYTAQCFALVDEKQEALDWLEHAIDLGLPNYPLMHKQDPFLENIRGEQRFEELIQRVKYEWEHFDV